MKEIDASQLEEPIVGNERTNCFPHLRFIDSLYSITSFDANQKQCHVPNPKTTKFKLALIPWSMPNCFESSFNCGSFAEFGSDGFNCPTSWPVFNLRSTTWRLYITSVVFGSRTTRFKISTRSMIPKYRICSLGIVDAANVLAFLLAIQSNAKQTATVPIQNWKYRGNNLDCNRPKSCRFIFLNMTI